MIDGLHRTRERFDAILFDLDGTLLDREGRVTAPTHRAVRALADAGFTVVLATGRSVAGSASIWRGLELGTPIAAYNGSWIGHPGRPPWRLLPIPDDLVAEVERTEAEARFSFRHEGHRKFTLPRPHRHYERVARWYENVVRVERVEHLPRQRLLRVSCYFDAQGETEQAWRRLSDGAQAALALQHYPMRIFAEFADTDLYLAEIQPSTRGKAEVFDWLAAERGIPAARTIAVGDQLNDLTMLAGAGLAVAVGNAVPEARAAADLVIGRHDEDGIARWVETGLSLPRPADAGRGPGGREPA